MSDSPSRPGDPDQPPPPPGRAPPPDRSTSAWARPTAFGADFAADAETPRASEIPPGPLPLPGPLPPRLPARIFATLALCAVVATYVAVEVDIVRRHHPGIEPAKYWKPQWEQVIMPGLAAALFCAIVALVLHKLTRRPSR